VQKLTEYSLTLFLIVETIELLFRPSLIASPSLMPSPLLTILLLLLILRSMSDRLFWIFAIDMMTDVKNGLVGRVALL
jgi:hypothetical protein